MSASVARAQGLGHPMTWVFALHFDAMLCAFAGDHAASRDKIEQALRLIHEQHLERVSGSHRWILGRALAALGEVDAGLKMMQEGRRLQQQQGLGYGLTRWYLNYASACLEADRIDAAMEAATEGCALARHSGEHAVSSELQQIRAAVLQRREQFGEAEAAYVEAITLAQQQNALCAEITARLGWCRLPGIDPPRAAAALIGVLARWTDPLALAPVQEARALLAALPQ